MQPKLDDQLADHLAKYTDIWYRMESAGHPPAAGKSEVTDWILDTALQPADVSNLFRAERFYLAQNWTEFLRFRPTHASIFRSEPSNCSQLMNTAVPLQLWSDAARNALVPRNLQAQIAQAGWVRAVILQDRNQARLLATHLAALKPELTAEMRAYLAETDPAAASFDAVFLMLRAPGFEPQIRPGWSRETQVLKRDAFRDNWWDLISGNQLRPTQAPEDLLELYPDGKFVSAATPAKQRKAGDAEWSKQVSPCSTPATLIRPGPLRQNTAIENYAAGSLFSSTHNPVGLWPVLQICATTASNGASGTRIADTWPSRQSHRRISNNRDSWPATSLLCSALTDTESANGNVQTTCSAPSFPSFLTLLSAICRG